MKTGFWSSYRHSVTQRRNNRVACVAKCQRHKASRGPLGTPASELKTLKIYLSSKYNYLKNTYYIFLFIWNFSCILSLIHLIDRPSKCRNLHNEELYNFYSSSNTIRQIKSSQMRWAGQVACMGEQRKMYKVLVGKHEGKRPLERPRHRWGQTGS
jgi:hypothetical protein